MFIPGISVMKLKSHSTDTSVQESHYGSQWCHSLCLLLTTLKYLLSVVSLIRTGTVRRWYLEVTYV